MTDSAERDSAPIAPEQLAQRFTTEMLDGCRILARDFGYRPAYFEKMLQELGGVETARRLLSGAHTAGGFTLLWEKGLLGRSSEAVMIRPEYAPLFSDAERRLARQRLVDHGFDVDAYLREVQGSTP